VLAAGNGEEEDKPLWVEFITPAAAGHYNGTNSGHIYTVSAAESSQSNTTPYAWTDKWWKGSYYGNEPPDFAEPGHNIQSLWLRDGTQNTLKKCSGTSFAAPHLSGIVARGGAPVADLTDEIADDPAPVLDRIGRVGSLSATYCPYAQ
jgi:hypothetical protein